MLALSIIHGLVAHLMGNWGGISDGFTHVFHLMGNWGGTLDG